MTRVERTLATRSSGRHVTPNSLDAGKPNSVRTTRFTLVTWLPKSLFSQFQRVANIYFLCISVMVCFSFSPIMWSSTVLPFCAVLLWTAFKDMYEDMGRRRDDDSENLRGCWRWDFNTKGFVKVAWRDILCGDVLLTLQDESIPADSLLLYAPGGQAYISTVNLDGETHLKERSAAHVLTAITSKFMEETADDKPWKTLKEPEARLSAIKSLATKATTLLLEQGLEVSLAAPKVELADMDGSVNAFTPTPDATQAIKERKVILPSKVNHESFLPRGAVLRNMPYSISLAGYVGDDTKTRLNCAETQAKVSNMQIYLNRGVQGLVCTLMAFCTYAALFAEIEGVVNPPDWPSPAFVVRFIVYWIILYQIVPISLYVGFEIVKLVLGWQINRDKQMRDPRTGVNAKARTADLVEEMGQVNFIFSDKTGTLTENDMVFASCCISHRDMGDFRLDGSSKSGKSAGQLELERIMALPANDPARVEAEWFFYCMTTCHSAQVDFDDAGKALFSGSSPDEVAFLDAADKVGLTFASRKRIAGKFGWELSVKQRSVEEPRVCEQLCEIPFNSDRKRMSVLVSIGGQVHVITKGADNMMRPLLREALTTADNQCLGQYSKQGLRTLVFATKTIDRVAYDAWVEQWRAAQEASEGQEERLAKLAAEVECGLKLAGISAIEDRLQQGVPEAIDTIKAAGIRFWVLTGDKTETAVEIVRACRLFTENMVLASMVNCTSPSHAVELLMAAKATLSGTEGGGLVLDGTFFSACVEADTGPELLYDLAMHSRACVCSRLSPKQKRKLVELVKQHNKMGITLAIGDGANDVPMLQGAHVGIGVRGKEGNQAVQASDVAISQFRFLVPLLMCHGRRAYRRVAVFLCYMLYKHISLAMGDMVWAHQCSRRFYGQIAYAEWLSSAFPAIITGLPVIVAIGLDIDLPDELVKLAPELYSEGIERLHFNTRVFTTWMLTAVLHGSMVWLIPSLWVGSDAWEAHSAPEYAPVDFWRASCCSFFALIIVINSRLWLYTYSPLAKYTVAVMCLSFFACFVTMFVLGETAMGDAMQPQISGVPMTIFTEPKYLIVMVVTPVVCLSFDLVFFFGWKFMYPTPMDSVRGLHKRGELVKRAVARDDMKQASAAVSAEKIKSISLDNSEVDIPLEQNAGVQPNLSEKKVEMPQVGSAQAVTM